jgi:hypothetical protein
LGLDRHTERVAEIEGLGIGHAELLRQFVYPYLLRHLAHQPFVFRPSLTDDSPGHTDPSSVSNFANSASPT